MKYPSIFGRTLCLPRCREIPGCWFAYAGEIDHVSFSLILIHWRLSDNSPTLESGIRTDRTRLARELTSFYESDHVTNPALSIPGYTMVVSQVGVPDTVYS